jgi:hypothetical protein
VAVQWLVVAAAVDGSVATAHTALLVVLAVVVDDSVELPGR